MAQQNLMSPTLGMMANITPGEAASRAMGQYGKGHSFAPTLSPVMPGAMAPGRDPGAAVRGGMGGTKAHVKLGGLGAGMMGTYGTPSDLGPKSDAG